MQDEQAVQDKDASRLDPDGLLETAMRGVMIARGIGGPARPELVHVAQEEGVLESARVVEIEPVVLVALHVAVVPVVPILAHDHGLVPELAFEERGEIGFSGGAPPAESHDTDRRRACVSIGI